MTELITKADLERELQIAFEPSYTDSYFLELANYAAGELESATNRSTFTGNSQYLAKKAMILSALEWFSLFNPRMFEIALSSISENGASLNFTSDVNIGSIRKRFDVIAAKLRLPGTNNYNVIMPDIAGTHLSTDTNVLY